MDIEVIYNFKIFLYLFPFLFSIIGFLLYLNNGEIINSIFFFFGLLLTILLGYIFKVMKIGTKHKKEINNICGVLLPNSLFEISTISISQLFYGYIISYIFLPKLLMVEEFTIPMIFGFIFLLICSFLDGFTFYKNKCSDINEILFGSFLGIFLSIFMLMVKKRYYGIEKPYKKPICSLMGNKYKCKKTASPNLTACNKGEDDYDVKVNYENNYSCALGEENKLNMYGIGDQTWLVFLPIFTLLIFLSLKLDGSPILGINRKIFCIGLFSFTGIFTFIYVFVISLKPKT